ncbi:glycosyltransferase family 2 protein [Sporolactobacillus shoreae]|nr:glycosyltransferase family 2 protein [Sporolactobacillus shoreae]
MDKQFNANTSVSIFMATYNGAKFIGKQLESLHHQNFANWQLWIRDDVSSDETVSVIKEFEEHDKRIHLIEDSKGRLGNAQNFNEVMNYSGDSDYFMFCDQDDYWFQDKISSSLTFIKEKERECGSNTPIAIFTDAEAVNENLETISNSFMKKVHVNPYDKEPLNKLLAQNYMYGCTMLLNKFAFKLSVSVPKDAEGHDYWVALVTSLYGHIFYLDKPTLKYRQHSNNVTGLKQGKLINKIKRNLTLKGWIQTNRIVDMSIRQANRLLDIKYDNPNKGKSKLVRDFVLHGTEGGLIVIPFLIKNRIFRQGKLRTLIYYLSMIRKNKNIYD